MNIKDNENEYVNLCLFVDDIIIVDRNDRMIKSNKDSLNSKFDINDMGMIYVILGIKISRISYGSVLNKSHCVDNILENFSKDDTDITVIFIVISVHPSKNKEEYFSNRLF